MSVFGWATMIGILTIVWGGFALCLATALRRERVKQDRDQRP